MKVVFRDLNYVEVLHSETEMQILALILAAFDHLVCEMSRLEIFVQDESQEVSQLPIK